MKEFICSMIGAVGGMIACALGGVDNLLIALIVFMVCDYITGMIVAGVFHASKKSGSGTLSSVAGFKGLCKKGVMLLFVLIAHQLDRVIGMDYARSSVIIGFLANELISLTENAGLMGVPLPSVIKKAIDLLNEKSEGQDYDESH